MTTKDFEKLVEEAIAALPARIRKEMKNVAVVIDEETHGGNFLGLYEGIPNTERGENYNLVMPDKITIFRKAIEEEALNAEEIPALARRVVWHEIGHHFGLSEKEIGEIERKQRGVDF